MPATREADRGAPSEGGRASTAELLRESVQSAVELVRIETTLAVNEAFEELRQLQASALAFVACATCASGALVAVVVAVGLGCGAAAELALAAILVVVAACLAGLGYKLLPRRTFVRTRERIRGDIADVRRELT